MATRKPPVVDPLVESLPPEPAPKNACDVEFQVSISPHLIGGEIKWLWTIVDHNAKEYVDDWTTITDLRNYGSVSEAEFAARRRIDQIRKAIEVKINMPEPVTLTL